MNKRDVSRFLTISLSVNILVVIVLIWLWGAGSRIIFVQPHFDTLAKIVPYALALACVYLGFISWIYFILSYLLDRWPATGRATSWLTPTEVSPRFLVLYAVVALLFAGLGVPFVSGRAHIVRSLVAELGFAGQGIALFGTIASIYGLLMLLAEDNRKIGGR